MSLCFSGTALWPKKVCGEAAFVGGTLNFLGGFLFGTGVEDRFVLGYSTNWV